MQRQTIRDGPLWRKSLGDGNLEKFGSRRGIETLTFSTE